MHEKSPQVLDAKLELFKIGLSFDCIEPGNQPCKTFGITLVLLSLVISSGVSEFILK